MQTLATVLAAALVGAALAELGPAGWIAVFAGLAIVVAAGCAWRLLGVLADLLAGRRRT